MAKALLLVESEPASAEQDDPDLVQTQPPPVQRYLTLVKVNSTA